MISKKMKKWLDQLVAFPSMESASNANAIIRALLKEREACETWMANGGDDGEYSRSEATTNVLLAKIAKESA